MEEKNVIVCKYCKCERHTTDYRKNRKKCKFCEKEDGRKYRRSDKGKKKAKIWEANNKLKGKELRADWYQQNKNKINYKFRERYKNDPIFRMHKNCQRRLCAMIHKEAETNKYVGCNSEFLSKWLEYCFDQNMNLDNYGSYWHIDHVIPVNIFNLENNEEIELCFNWRNLSPMIGEENMSKHDTIDLNQVKNHLNKLIYFHKENNLELPIRFIDLYTKYLN